MRWQGYPRLMKSTAKDMNMLLFEITRAYWKDAGDSVDAKLDHIGTTRKDCYCSVNTCQHSTLASQDVCPRVNLR